MISTKAKRLRWIRKYLFLFLGATLAAIGLEIFLVPNQIVDGGLTGISIMLSFLTGWPLGAFIFVLNLPFLLLGYRQIGKSFVVSTMFALTVLSVGVSILHPIPGLTQDIFLAAVFGGIILGMGVGMVVRYGGSMDGTEIIAIVTSKKSPFSY